MTATLSGSSNTHSRLAPSGAKSWTKCTASISYVEANKDRILPLKIAEVVRLTSYLTSIPEDEVFDHEWRAMRAVKNYLSDIDHGTSKRLSYEAAEKKARKKLTPQMVADIWQSAGSPAAREGTRAHEFAAGILLGTKVLSDIPEEFQPHVGAYVDHCRRSTDPHAETFIETKVPLFYSGNPDDTGTCDFAVITEDKVKVIDLKYGAGVLVEAIDNEQLAIYALSFVEDNMALYGFEPDTVIEMHIVQPRHREGDEVKTWSMPLCDLRLFCAEIRDAAKVVRSGEGLEFLPGEDTCRWCDAKKFCEARSKSLLESFDLPEMPAVDFLAGLPDLTKDEKKETPAKRIKRRTKKPDGLDDATLIRMWKATKNIQAFLGDIAELIEERAQLGDDFGGEIKLVTGREGNRAWSSLDEAKSFLLGLGTTRDQIVEESLISPAKAETLLKGKNISTEDTEKFNNLVVRSPGKPVVALSSDKREAIACLTDLLPDLNK